MALLLVLSRMFYDDDAGDYDIKLELVVIVANECRVGKYGKGLFSEII